MKKITTSFFVLALVVACIAPAIAEPTAKEIGLVSNTLPEIDSIETDLPSVPGTATIEVIAEDNNGFQDLDKCVINLYFEDGPLVVMDEITSNSPERVAGEPLKGKYTFEIEIPATWNPTNYKIDAIPYDKSSGIGIHKESDGNANLEHLVVPTSSGISCSDVCFVDLIAGSQSKTGQLTITNTGNQDLTLNFSFTDMELDEDNKIPKDLNGAKNLECRDLNGKTIGFIGTPAWNAADNGGVRYKGTDLSGTGMYDGTVTISKVPCGIIKGEYLGTYTVSF